jgi:cell wall-associated NlpC family hydrolase
MTVQAIMITMALLTAETGKSETLRPAAFDHLGPTQIAVLGVARSYLNVGYHYGGKDVSRPPYQLDCSGYVRAVFAAVPNLPLLPHGATAQAQQGLWIESFDDLRPADLAFFENSRGEVIHAAIVGGEPGHIFHASGERRQRRVVYEPIDRGLRAHFAWGRRVIEQPNARVRTVTVDKVRKNVSSLEIKRSSGGRRKHRKNCRGEGS